MYRENIQLNMDTHETNGLFIFRRDLRLIDNVGLYRASKMCDRLYTCFILHQNK